MVAMYRVRTEFTGLPGMPALNQLYFSASTGTASAATVATSIFWGGVMDKVNESVIYNVLGDVEIVESTTGMITAVESGTPGSGVGQEAIDQLPPATQGLLRLRTGIFENGREIRGKVFIPGLTESSSVDGQVNSDTETAIQTAIDGLLGTASVNLLVWSRKNLSSASVASASVWNQFAVLRSRRD